MIIIFLLDYAGILGKSITVGTTISLVAHTFLDMMSKKASPGTPDKGKIFKNLVSPLLFSLSIFYVGRTCSVPAATTVSPHLRKLKSICPIEVIKFFCSILDLKDDVFRYV